MENLFSKKFSSIIYRIHVKIKKKGWSEIHPCKDEADAKHALKLAPQARDPFPWYQHEEIGCNCRMSNICAGIGCGQMRVIADRWMYCAAAMYVLTSEMEGLPMFLPEAKSYGLPIVSFDIETGSSDIVRDGVNGYLVKSGDTDTVAEKIYVLIAAYCVQDYAMDR